jgi:hypothetical protein
VHQTATPRKIENASSAEAEEALSCLGFTGANLVAHLPVDKTKERGSLKKRATII